MLSSKIVNLDATLASQIPHPEVEIESKELLTALTKIDNKKLSKHIMAQQIIDFGNFKLDGLEMIMPLQNNLFAYVTSAYTMERGRDVYDDQWIRNSQVIIFDADKKKEVKVINFGEDIIKNMIFSVHHGLIINIIKTFSTSLKIFNTETFEEKISHQSTGNNFYSNEAITADMQSSTMIFFQKANNKYHLREWQNTIEQVSSFISLDYLHNEIALINPSIITIKFIFKNKFMLVSKNNLYIHDLPLSEKPPIRIHDFPKNLLFAETVVTYDELSLIMVLADKTLSIWSMNKEFILTELKTFSHVSVISNNCFPDGSIAFVQNGVINVFNPVDKDCIQIDEINDPNCKIKSLTIIEDGRLSVLKEFKNTAIQGRNYKLQLYLLTYLQKRWGSYLTAKILEESTGTSEKYHHLAKSAGAGDIVAKYCYAPAAFFCPKKIETAVNVDLEEKKQETTQGISRALQ